MGLLLFRWETNLQNPLEDGSEAKPVLNLARDVRVCRALSTWPSPNGKKLKFRMYGATAELEGLIISARQLKCNKHHWSRWKFKCLSRILLVMSWPLTPRQGSLPECFSYLGASWYRLICVAGISNLGSHSHVDALAPWPSIDTAASLSCQQQPTSELWLRLWKN